MATNFLTSDLCSIILVLKNEIRSLVKSLAAKGGRYQHVTKQFSQSVHTCAMGMIMEGESSCSFWSPRIYTNQNICMDNIFKACCLFGEAAGRNGRRVWQVQLGLHEWRGQWIQREVTCLQSWIGQNFLCIKMILTPIMYLSFSMLDEQVCRWSNGSNEECNLCVSPANLARMRWWLPVYIYRIYPSVSAGTGSIYI